jgi:hypothetical protein
VVDHRRKLTARGRQRDASGTGCLAKPRIDVLRRDALALAEEVDIILDLCQLFAWQVAELVEQRLFDRRGHGVLLVV